MNYFEKIPNELVLEIFSFLPVHTIRCVLPMVCRSWRQLACDPQLWKNVFVSGDSEGMCFSSASSLEIFIARTPYIRNISCPAQMLKTLAVICKQNIRSLQLSGLRQNLPNLSSFTSLEKLTILTTYKEERWRELNSERNRSSILLKIPAYAPHITHLTVESALSNSDVEFIVTELRNILDLRICIAELSPETIASLARLPLLKKLSISDYHLSIKKLLSLNSLPLVKAELSEPFKSPVFQSSELNRLFIFGKSALRNLRHLSLLKCHVSDATAEQIRLSCPVLSYLEVREWRECEENKLTENGIVHLLHLWNLRVLEVTAMKGADWYYRRDRWKRHECDPNKPCTLGLRALLNDWKELMLRVD